MAKTVGVISFLRTQAPARKTDYYEVYNKSLAPALVLNSLIEVHIALAGSPKLRQCTLCYEIQDEGERWTCVCHIVRVKGPRYTQLAALMAPSSEFEKGKISPLALGTESEWADVFGEKHVKSATVIAKPKSNKYPLPQPMIDALNGDPPQSFYWPQECATIELLEDAVRIAQEAAPDTKALSRCILLGVPGDFARPSFLKPALWIAAKPEEQKEQQQTERSLMFDTVSAAIVQTANKVAASSSDPTWRNRVWDDLHDLGYEWSLIHRDKFSEASARQVRRLHKRYEAVVDARAVLLLDRDAQSAVYALAGQLESGFGSHSRSASYEAPDPDGSKKRDWTDYLLPIGFGIFGVLFLIAVAIALRENFVAPSAPRPALPVTQLHGASPDKPAKHKATAEIAFIDTHGISVITTGETITAAVHLSKTATEDTDVSLEAGGPEINVRQDSVTVPAGQKSAEFRFIGVEPTRNRSIALKAKLGDSSQTTHIKVVPEIEIRIHERTHFAGEPVDGEVILAHPAGDGGVVVAMSTDRVGAFPDQPEVNIPKGRTSDSFSISTSKEMGKTSMTVIATLPDDQTATKKVNIAAP